VDDPETATIESEAAGMTWEREQLRHLTDLISNAADGTESTISKLRLGEDLFYMLHSDAGRRGES